jgi:3',5'-cyclic AMP phosphodiesterase CpdA
MIIDRKQFLKLAGLGGLVYASGLARGASAAPASEFYFVQLSDSHWGFSGPPNPEAATTLKRAVAAVNALDPAPDFIVFTGDLTHTTDDEKERRRRMAEFRDIVGGLKVKTVRFMPGEHDAALDKGAAFKEFFGAPNYTFEHKGVHFIALDNVSDPTGAIGDQQLQWLNADLKKLDKAQPIAVLTHRPLFDLYPQWDWATKDAAQAIEMLTAYENVTVFYGHIHQENHHTTGHIQHHSAKSLMFPLPAPGSVPKRVPVAWDPAHPFAGLGWREIEAEGQGAKRKYGLKEFGIKA